MDTVLIDTDLLVHLLTAGDPLQVTARDALRALRSQRVTFCTTVQNIAEFWNVCTRPTSARNGLGMEASEVMPRVQLINRWINVLSESEASYAVLLRLVETYSIHGSTVHDARLVSVMIANQVEKILTFNGKDFQRYAREGIEALAPELLAKA